MKGCQGKAVWFAAGLIVTGAYSGAGVAGPSRCDFVFTQTAGALTWRAGEQRTWGDGARILRFTEGKLHNLAADFHSAADPEVSFDGSKILFAGKRTAAEPWNIFEMDANGVAVRQITHSTADCRSPIYQSSIFYLDDAAPAPQIAYVSGSAIYSARMDGSGVRRLTYNPAGAFDPAMLPDGRMVFTSGRPGRMVLFGINVDGTDYAAFAGEQGRGLQTAPFVTPDRRVLFIEPAPASRDGAGYLSSIDLRRNLHSYRRLTANASGLIHSAAPLPDGGILVARRAAPARATYGIYRLDPNTQKLTRLFAAEGTHQIQPRALAARDIPDGRSSVVDEKTDWAKLYGLNLYDGDLASAPRGSVRRIRIIEGGQAARLIGEAPVDEDGSFHVQIPANTPVKVQALDENGMALSGSAWFWAKNKEQRGCIGCHEDGERTPENVMATALTRPAANLVLPPERRRTVEFTRDIEPLLRQKCANGACHGANPASLVNARHIAAGEARKSPLVWSLLGRNPNAGASVPKMPPASASPLTDSERRAIIEWIDLGAHGLNPTTRGKK